MILYINGIIYKVSSPLRLVQLLFRWFTGKLPQFYIVSLFETDYFKYLTDLQCSGDYLTGNLGPKIIRRSSYKKLGPAYQASIRRSVTCTQVIFILPYLIRVCDEDPSAEQSQKDIRPDFGNRQIGKWKSFDEDDDELQDTIADFEQLSNHFELPSELTTEPAKRIIRLMKRVIKSVEKEPLDEDPEYFESAAILKIDWFKTHFILSQTEKKKIENLLKKLKGRDSIVDTYPFARLSSDLYTDLFFWKYNTKKILKKCPPITEFSRFCVLSRNRIFQQFPNTKKDISLFWIIARRQWDVLSDSEKANRKFIALKPYQPYADHDELKRFLVYSSEDSEIEDDPDRLFLDKGCARKKDVSGSEQNSIRTESKTASDDMSHENDVQATESLSRMSETDTIIRNGTETSEKQEKDKDQYNSTEDAVTLSLTVSKGKDTEVGDETDILLHKGKNLEEPLAQSNQSPAVSNIIDISFPSMVTKENFEMDKKKSASPNQTENVLAEKDNSQSTAYEVRSPSTIVQTPQTTPPRIGDIEDVLASDLKSMATRSGSELGSSAQRSSIPKSFEDRDDASEKKDQHFMFQGEIVTGGDGQDVANAKIYRNGVLCSSPIIASRRNSIISDASDLRLHMRLISDNSSEIEEDCGFEAEDDEPSRVVSFDNSLETGTSSPTIESVKSLPMVKLRKVQKQTSGKIPSTNLDVNELLHEADEASSVTEKVDKYEKIIHTILGPRNCRKRSATFINALSGWVSAEDDYNSEHNISMSKSKCNRPKRQRSLNLMESLDSATLEKLYEERNEEELNGLHSMLKHREKEYKRSKLSENYYNGRNRSLRDRLNDLLDDRMMDMANSAEYKHKMIHPQDLYERFVNSRAKPWSAISNMEKEPYYEAFKRQYYWVIYHPNRDQQDDIMFDIAQVCIEFGDMSSPVVLTSLFDVDKENND